MLDTSKSKLQLPTGRPAKVSLGASSSSGPSSKKKPKNKDAGSGGSKTDGLVMPSHTSDFYPGVGDEDK